MPSSDHLSSAEIERLFALSQRDSWRRYVKARERQDRRNNVLISSCFIIAIVVAAFVVVEVIELFW